MTNSGTIQPDLSCSAVTPPEASCPVPEVDLQAFSVSPSANYSQSEGTVQFQGTMRNDGPDNQTIAVFADLEIDTNGDGTEDDNYNAHFGTSINSLANGATRNLQYNLAGLTPGNYHYRFKVDTQYSNTDDPAFANNVSPWRAFTILPPPIEPECNDGEDNDGDGRTDYPSDPGCSSATDDDEFAGIDLRPTNNGPIANQTYNTNEVISFAGRMYNDGPDIHTTDVFVDLEFDTTGNGSRNIYTNVNSDGSTVDNDLVDGQYVPVSRNYSFSTPGTYYYRFNVDTAFAAPELNEGNNQSGWVRFYVQDLPTPTATLSMSVNGGTRNYASSVAINAGQSVRLYWDSDNASTCTVTQGAGAGFVISPAWDVDGDDSTITEPTAGNSVTFGISCVNSAGVAATDTLVLSTNVPDAFDLQAFSTAPANNGSFSTGAAINFTGSFRNNGPGAVTPSFYADLEIDRNGDGIVASGDNHNAKSGGGYFTQNYNAGDTQTLGYSLYGLPAGSYRYRFNVDTNDQVPGESNETNNVSAWRSFTVTAAPTPSGTITGSSCTIAIGASTCEGSLTWNVSNPGSGTPNVRNLTNNSSVDSGNATRTNHSTNLTYGNSDFSVRVNTTDLNTVRLTTSCALGGTWNGAMCAANVSIGPSGTISGTGCVIADGEKTCVGELTWNVTESSGNTNVYDVSNTATVSTGDDNENNFSVPLTEGTHSFRLRDNTTVLNSVDLIAQCSATATWNGSICEVNTGGGGGGTPTVDADLSAIRDGDEVTITWDPALNLNCVMTSSANFPVGTIFTTPGSYTFNAPGNQSLSRTTEFVYKCDGVPAVTEKVFVLPTIFET